MQKIDETYILAGLGWLIFAMGLGIWIGWTGMAGQAGTHAHAGLAGFVPSVLFGLVLRLFPAMRGSRLVKPQFWIYQAGAALLVAGELRAGATGQNDLAAFASIVILCGAVLFLVLFWQNRQVRPDIR